MEPGEQVDHSPARQRFQNVLGASASPYLLVFDDLTIVDATPAAETFLSRTATALWGEGLATLLHVDDDRTLDRSAALAQGDPTAGWPAVLRAGGGERLEVDVTASTVERAGDPGRFYLILELTLPATAATRRALQAEASYDRLMALAHEGVWEVDTDGRTISANQRMADMLGCSLSELEGASLMDFLDEDGRLEARDALARRRTGVAEQRDVVFHRRDGTQVHALVSATPHHGPDGSISGSLAVVLDVTERVERDARLRRADERFTQSFELAPIPKAIVTTDGHFLQVNPAFCEFLGRDTDELRGCHYRDVLAEQPTDDQEAGWNGVIAGTRKTFSTELRCRHSAGYDAWARLTISGLSGEDGSVDSLVVQLVDITEDRLMQTNLREARDRYEALFDHAPVGLAQVTLDGRILSANAAFASLLGLEAARLSGRSIDDVVRDSDRQVVRRLLGGVREGSGSDATRVGCLGADGAGVTALLAAALVPDAGGRPAYVIVTLCAADAT